MLSRLIINLGLKYPDKFTQILFKAEYAVAAFCFKAAKQARQEKLFNLSEQLKNHAISEKKHGKMLKALFQDSKTIVNPECDGQWLKMIRSSTGELLAGEENIKNDLGIQVSWDSERYPGDQIIGVFENFDGISRRFLTFRIFFKNRTASSFSWADKLAFMLVLEGENQKFYQLLAKSPLTSESLAAIAQKIADDEQNHVDYLKYAIGSFTDFSKETIEKWQQRLFCAKIGLIVDLWELFAKDIYGRKYIIPLYFKSAKS